MPKIISRYVEVCVYRVESTGPRFLLLRRKEDDALYPGIWQIVTGTIETAERAVDAALRELSEETGLVPEAFWTLPCINSLYSAGEDAIELHPMFAARVGPRAEMQLSPEHSRSGWFSPGDALGKLIWPAQRQGLRIVHEFIIGGEKASILTRIF